MRVIPLFTLLLTFSACVAADAIYKYQDANGRWHFTDKKPAHIQADELQYQQQADLFVKPSLQTRQEDGRWQLWVVNPWYAPVEVAVKLHEGENGTVHQMVQANSEVLIADDVSPGKHYEHTLLPGDPSAIADGTLYRLPVQRNIQHHISQAFSGRFSHQQEPNIYAVDISLPVGSDILAARDGVVMRVQDNYVLDGVDEYFMDKANLVQVLHSDGTIAVYAHLLASSAKVRAGQSVKAGDVLGLSGSTGFSTGPHLHFVVWRNAGLRYVSVPFRFTESGAESWLPAAGMILEP